MGDRREVPGIPYIGKAPEGYRNPPAPHLEMVYLLGKGVDRVSAVFLAPLPRAATGLSTTVWRTGQTS